MTRPRGTDAGLLLLVAACLFFGGGFGCEEEADGVQFKLDTFDGERYLGINGKKPPGEGSIRLPYNLEPPFFGKIDAGIIDPGFLMQTTDAVAYGQMEREDLAESYRMELRYEVTPSIGLRINSNVDLNEAFCPGATRARVRIDDDGVDALLRYRCPGATGPTSPPLPRSTTRTRTGTGGSARSGSSRRRRSASPSTASGAASRSCRRSSARRASPPSICSASA